MTPDTNDAIDLIDLGVASVETQGGGKALFDIVDQQPLPGLSND